MDYEVQRCTRHCAATGRELVEGEEFYTALVREGAQLRRLDFAVNAWQGPPEGAIGSWKSRMPTRDARKPRLAPNEVLLELFVNLEGAGDRADLRYVLALLLVRRRVLRLEDTESDAAGNEVLVLYCPREDVTYRAASLTPDEDRTREIQDELSRLLFATAE